MRLFRFSENNSRLQNTVRNMSWQFACQIITLVIGVILPKYIIEVYGSDVNGLTSTIKQVLTLVTIVQSGLGTSAAYLMFKPLEEKNRIRIASLLKSINKIYKTISFTVAVIGLLASLVLAFTVKGEVGGKYIFIASFITCIDSALSLYFTAACNLFLSAKQDKYINSIVTLTTGSLSCVIQVLILVIKPSFLFLYFNNMFICLLNILILTKIFKKQYKPYEPAPEDISKVEYVPIPSVGHAALNEASHSAVTGLLTVIVSIMGNLKAASVVSVYLMISNLISTVSNVAYTSFTPSYGSMVAEGNMEKTNRVFEIFQFSFFAMTTFFMMCASYLILPFVKLYTVGVTDANYVNELLMILVIFYGLFYAFRIPYNNTVSVAGLFKQTCVQPIVSALIAIALMFALVKINYALIMVGPILFYIANTFYQHFALPRLFKGFKNSHFWKHLSVSIIGVTLSLCAAHFVPIAPSSFILWIVYAIPAALISFVITVILTIIIDRKSLRLTVDFFKTRIKAKNYIRR